VRSRACWARFTRGCSLVVCARIRARLCLPAWSAHCAAPVRPCTRKPTCVHVHHAAPMYSWAHMHTCTPCSVHALAGPHAYMRSLQCLCTHGPTCLYAPCSACALMGPHASMRASKDSYLSFVSRMQQKEADPHTTCTGRIHPPACLHQPLLVSLLT